MNIKQPLKAVAAIALIGHLSACGTLLYPERKGQVSGRIDTGVAALNGIGLLFFLVPGVIAFAVDFNNGTIYLPNTGNVEGEDDGMRVVKSDEPLDMHQVRRLVAAETGQDVDLDSAETRNMRMTNEAAVAYELKQQRTATAN
ncbi:MAG: hypothetical protein WEA82_00165 [Idiomarina sp.]